MSQGSDGLNFFKIKIFTRFLSIKKMKNKFALLLGEAQLCLPYVCLLKQIAYSYPMLTYSYPKVT